MISLCIVLVYLHQQYDGIRSVILLKVCLLQHMDTHDTGAFFCTGLNLHLKRIFNANYQIAFPFIFNENYILIFILM